MTENHPLTSDELKRLDDLALEILAAHPVYGACPECNLEPGLVVRAVEEIRELRRQASEDRAPLDLADTNPLGSA